MRTNGATQARLLAWLCASAVLLSDAAALAEEAGLDGSQASRGSPLCSLVMGLALIAVFRGRGVGWGLSIGTAILPGLFGWFVWRDRTLGFGIRLFALVIAILQAAALTIGIAAAIAIPNFLRYQAARSAEKASTRPVAAPTDGAPVFEPDPDGSRALDATAKITSRPAGARVFLDGTEEGLTPLETRVKAGKSTTFRVELDGHLPQSRSLKAEPGGGVEWAAELVAGGTLLVTTTPPGASVLVDGVVVLERTPGTTSLLPPQATEVVVALAGYAPQVKRVELAPGTQPLEATLTPGVKVPVSSSPAGAEVRLDGTLLGRTPLELFVAPGAKQTLVVSLPPRTPATRVLAKVKPGLALHFKLVDEELVALEQRWKKAKASLDRAESTATRLQFALEERASDAGERQLDAAERALERAGAELENATAALDKLRAARGEKPAE